MTRDDLIADVDRAQLKDPAYFEQVRQRLLGLEALEPRYVAQWFLKPHRHTCPTCGNTLEHTGLVAVRDGNGPGEPAHRCCNEDVRRIADA